ncbi:nucleolus and neural progenitor protein isoform X2 [Corythoichthys intestinalis]|uniref:nucleolus and neural progenitor protein isoform X2 n=1 Tax=Corythoichthys intestinalis TaxID=161448 RepID=UPI0025A5BB2A|nr:nucleolus and neural progenitor protein isoform X2 [Corythoichthys intestinalis]
MAAEPWNRVNVSQPSAISTVRVQFTSKTDLTVKNLLLENDKVLRILQSTFLQTEVRVLYALLYNLNNSTRGNKTFRVVKQVEQCINRLKEMKLDVALQSLAELCPKRIQRQLGIKAKECELPSQPTLEWECLKVLGAAQLMSCTLKRCSRAFILSKQHMRNEFIILNMVLTSMLSRLWVSFRGILSCLSALYQHLLALRAEVALARPMPFLTYFELPANMADFLGPCEADLLAIKPKSGVQAPAQGATQRRKPLVRATYTKKVKEDLGVAVQRELALDSDIKPINVTRTVAKILPKKEHKAERKRMFQRHTMQAATFKEMTFNLEEMIKWCKSKKMSQTKQLLTFLRLKCRRLTGAEAAGYNVQNKLQAFKQNARQALCGVRSQLVRTRHSSSPGQKSGRLRKHLWSLKMRFRSTKMRNNVKKRRKLKKGLSNKPPGADWISRTIGNCTPMMVNGDSTDDIDDIFASVGL